MSWVVARHLYKSGNNNIKSRIGRYNRQSSTKCQRLRKIAIHAQRTRIAPLHRYFHLGRDYELYTIMDEYRSRKTLSIYFEWAAQSNAPCRAPYWKAKNAFHNIWTTNDIDYIVDTMYKDCSTTKTFLCKFNYKSLYSRGVLHRPTMFRNIIVVIINKNKKYTCLDPFILYRRRFIYLNTAIKKCIQRWESLV